MALIETFKTSNGSTIAIWKIDETSEELLQKYSLKEEEISRFNTISAEKRKREWLATRLTLKHLLGNEPTIAYYVNGKPFLENSDNHISISHSSNMAIVIINPTHQVAIDTETISDRVLRIKNKFLAPQEIAFLEQLEVPNVGMLLAWCSKETLFKLAGKENIDFKTAYQLSPFEIKKKGGIMATYATITPPLTIRLNYQIIDNNIVVYAEMRDSI